MDAPANVMFAPAASQPSHSATPKRAAPDAVAGGNDCAVCLEAITPADGIFTGPCQHSFHVACAEQQYVIARKTTCPLCRAPFPNAPGFVALQRAALSSRGGGTPSGAYSPSAQRSSYGTAGSSPMMPRHLAHARLFGAPAGHGLSLQALAQQRPELRDIPLAPPPRSTQQPAAAPETAAALSETFAAVTVLTDVTSVTAGSGSEDTTAVTALVRVAFAGGSSAQFSAVPADFVILADVSGSMGGEKIDAVRDALLKLSDGIFGEQDRVALVVFNEIATQCTPLAPLAVPSHQAAFRNAAMTRCSASGGTSISAALECAFGILDGREAHSNPLQQVLLLSDGQDGEAAASLDALLARRAAAAMAQADPPVALPASVSLPEGAADQAAFMEVTHPASPVAVTATATALNQSRFASEVTITALGFGADHDAEQLASISARGRGAFSYVERSDLLDEVLAGWVGDVTSVLARGTCVRLEPAPGTRVLRVTGPGVVSPADPATGAVSVDLGFARVGASRQLLVELSVTCPQAAEGGSPLQVLTASVTACAIHPTAAAVEAGNAGEEVTASPAAVASLLVRASSAEVEDAAQQPTEERAGVLRDIAIARNREILGNAAAAVAMVLDAPRGREEDAAAVVEAARASLLGDEAARSPAAGELATLLRTVRSCGRRVGSRASRTMHSATHDQYGFTPSPLFGVDGDDDDARDASTAAPGGGVTPGSATYYAMSDGARTSINRMRHKKAASTASPLPSRLAEVAVCPPTPPALVAAAAPNTEHPAPTAAAASGDALLATP